MSNLEKRAAIDFVLTLRRRWADTLYPRLREEYEVARTQGSGEVAERIHRLPTYGGFAWLERGSQKMLWRAAMDALHATIEAPQDARPGPATLELDPRLKLPDWYTSWDIHLQPGGVWSSRAASRVYELGARLVMLGDNDDYKFHRLFVETAIPKRDYRRIVDLGCDSANPLGRSSGHFRAPRSSEWTSPPIVSSLPPSAPTRRSSLFAIDRRIARAPAFRPEKSIW
jgi:hypothetical protein